MASGSLTTTLFEDAQAAAANPSPGATVFAVDGSGSIGTTTFHGQVKQVLYGLLSTCQAEEEVGVLQFATGIRWETNFGGSHLVPLSKRDTVIDQIEKMQFMGQGTDQKKAALAALTILSEKVNLGRGYRTRFFMITDGHPSDKVAGDPTEPLKAMSALGTLVYVIGVGNDIPLAQLEKWASPRAFLATNFSTLLNDLKTYAKQKTYSLNVSLFPSVINGKKNTYLPRQKIYLRAEITNTDLDPIPAGAILQFKANPYFMQRMDIIKTEIGMNETVELETELSPAATATEFNYPKEVFFSLLKSRSDLTPMVSGAAVVGTQFLAGQYLPQPTFLPNGSIDEKAPVPWGNCMVFGLMGTGKSSLLNAIFTCMTTSEVPLKPLTAMKAEDHVTTTYTKITFDPFQDKMLTNGQRFPIHFWDSWGLNLKGEAYEGTYSIENFLAGYFPDGFEKPRGPTARPLTPDPNRRIHCVLFVFAVGMRYMEVITKRIKEMALRMVHLDYQPILVATHADLEDASEDTLRREIIDATGIDRVILFQNYTEEKMRSPAIDLKSREIIGMIVNEIMMFKTRPQVRLPPASPMPPREKFGCAKCKVATIPAPTYPSLCPQCHHIYACAGCDGCIGQGPGLGPSLGPCPICAKGLSHIQHECPNKVKGSCPVCSAGITIAHECSNKKCPVCLAGIQVAHECPDKPQPKQTCPVCLAGIQVAHDCSDKPKAGGASSSSGPTCQICKAGLGSTGHPCPDR